MYYIPELLYAPMLSLSLAQKKVTGHPNIIQFLGASAASKDKAQQEYLLLTELCTGGSFAYYSYLHLVNNVVN